MADNETETATITISREDAEELRYLVTKARDTIRKINPSLSARLDIVVMALHANLNDPEKLPEPTPDVEPTTTQEPGGENQPDPEFTDPYPANQEATYNASQDS